MNPIMKALFDLGAQDYDQQRRQLIPCFDDFYGIAAEWVNTPSTAPKILDLGAGTGLFSAFVKQKYSDAEFTLIDISEPMLKQAEARFGPGAKVTHIIGDYTTYPLEEKYDAVISSLSIHHLTHDEKRALFRRIFALLKEGGVFVNADQAAGRTTSFDDRYRHYWLAEVRASGLAESAIEASIERRKQDINATVHDQLTWLSEAGFAEADCVYKRYDFAVFFAAKS